MKARNSKGIILTLFSWKIFMLSENIFFLFEEIAICDQKQLLKFSASSNKDVFKYVLCY